VLSFMLVLPEADRSFCRITPRDTGSARGPPSRFRRCRAAERWAQARAGAGLEVGRWHDRARPQVIQPAVYRSAALSWRSASAGSKLEPGHLLRASVRHPAGDVT